MRAIELLKPAQGGHQADPSQLRCMCHGSIDESRSEEGTPLQPVVLAKNAPGYRNLGQDSPSLATARHARPGHLFRAPDRQAVAAPYSEGLIVATACLAVNPRRFLKGARSGREWPFYQEALRRRLLLEIPAHGFPGKTDVNGEIVRIVPSWDIELIATNDATTSPATTWGQTPPLRAHRQLGEHVKRLPLIRAPNTSQRGEERWGRLFADHLSCGGRGSPHVVGGRQSGGLRLLGGVSRCPLPIPVGITAVTICAR